MSQVLGVDIGSYSIKFALLELEKSSVLLKDTVEVKIPFSEQKDEFKSAKIQALKQALAKIDLSQIRDNIYVGLGSQYAILQNFEFLNVARKHLEKIVENEFDDLGLFSLNEYIVDYTILKRVAKQTNVLGILIKKAEARDLIDILDTLNLTSRTIDLNCLALQNLVPYVPQLYVQQENNQPSVSLVVNIGHQKTSVVVMEENRVVLERSFNLAGHYITTKIQAACNVSYQDAEDLKHKVSGKVEHSSDQSQLAKTVMLDCCKEIAKEIERLFLSLKQKEEGKEIDSILLTGGTSRIVNLAQVIEQTIGVKTSNLAFSEENFTNNSEIEHVYELFGQAIALALRATGARTNSHINIRQGEFALISDYENLIDQIFKYSKLAAIILVCLLGTYLLRSYLYTAKINQIKTLYNNQVISYFGTEPLELKVISSKANWNFEQYYTQSWELIQQNYKQKLNFIENLTSQKSMMPLVILNEISAAIPKNIYFEVSHYNFKDGVLSLQADSDSQASVNEIMKRLSNINLLKNVQKKSEIQKPGTQGKIITFSVLATLNSQESG